MQPLDWSDLHDFLAVARAGQMARAAQALGVDPTTLARRIRRLEARLGRTLFEQTRTGQSLTAAGEAMLAHVEAMERAAQAIAETGDGAMTGSLRVSVSEGFGTWFVARHLPDFAARWPQLTVDLVASSGFLNPSRREADLAVLLHRPASGPVISGKLADYALRLYAARDWVEQGGMPRDERDLAEGTPLIGYIPDLLYAPELRYLDEIGGGLTPTLRSSSINAQHALIAGGAGVGVLPCFIGDRDSRLVRVLPARRIERSFWLVTHRDTRELRRIRLFRDWLRELVQRERGVLMGV